MMKKNTYTLILTCRNQPGIVSYVSKFIFDAGGDIYEAHQFDDPDTGRFYMRVGFTCTNSSETATTLRKNLFLLLKNLDLLEIE